MWTPIVLAFFNGIAVGINRIFNGQLAHSKSALQASFWNHLVGFLFLLPVGLILGSFAFLENAGSLPFYVYAGGMLGAFFVAISSWVIARAGALNGIILVVAGQMLVGTVIDALVGRIQSLPMAFVGVGLILIGVKISQLGLQRGQDHEVPERMAQH